MIRFSNVKIHIIRDHLADKLRQTGETLVDESDEHRTGPPQSHRILKNQPVPM